MTLVPTAVRKARIRRQILKHYGPGAHPGTGTEQTVHDPGVGGGGGDEGGLFGEETQEEQGGFTDTSGLEQTEAGVGAAPGSPLATESSGEATSLGVPDVDPGARDVSYEEAIRPATLEEFVGQDALVSRLQVMTSSAREQGRPLDHILFSGPPGLGKTTLAQMMANEMGTNIKIVTAGAIKDKGDLAAMVLSLEDGDILFIDEIHALNDKTAELLYPVMEDFQVDVPLGEGGTVRMDTARFTLLGATTEAGSLPAPLRDRFSGGVEKLNFYEPKDLASIVERTSGVLGVNLDQSAYLALATRAQGTPRKANNLAKWMRDWAAYHDLETVSGSDVEAALSLRGVDPGGLRREDRSYLSFLSSSEHPVGENTIASFLGESKETVSDEIEPYLLRDGYIMRTPRGRVITDKGLTHIEEYGVDWGATDLEDAYQVYKHLPGRHDQKDHGIWARTLRTLQEFFATPSAPKMLHEVTKTPAESKLVRRFKTLAIINKPDRLSDVVQASFSPHERTHLRDIIARANQNWLLDDLEPVFAKHYGPGPHKTGTPQSVHRGSLPHWFDDVSLIQSHVRDRPEIAPEVEEWALGRIDELREEMGNVTSERDKKAIGEEVHALTTVWATAYNVRTSGYPSGEMPPDIKRKYDRWYEAYLAENLAERERRSIEFTEATETGGVSYIPYQDRISEDDDFLAPLIDINVSGGQPFVQDVPDIQPGAIVFGPTGPFRVDDKIGPKVSDLPSYPPGGEVSRPRGSARPRSNRTAPVGRPADLDPDHTRFIGRDASGRPVNLDLPYDGIAPPFIPDHRAADIERLFQKMIQKHGNHNQKDHGNWARGTSARQMLDQASSSGEPLSGNRGLTKYMPTGSEPDSGFGVGMSERSQWFPSKPSPDQVREYIRANRDLLNQADGQYHIGFWEAPDGRWSLDVSQVFESPDEAFEIYPEEEAIFDFSTFETIYNPAYDVT